MSQPLGKRGTTSEDWYKNLTNLCDELEMFLVRDFGIKNQSRDLKVFLKCAKMTAQDSAVMEYLCEKYNIATESSYPLYMIERHRNKAFDLLDEMESNLYRANTIFPTSVYEFNRRTSYQWDAQSQCYELLQLMQKIMRRLPVNVQKEMRYVEMLKDMVKSIKRWRNSDKKRLPAILKKEEGKTADILLNAILEKANDRGIDLSQIVTKSQLQQIVNNSVNNRKRDKTSEANFNGLTKQMETIETSNNGQSPITTGQ